MKTGFYFTAWAGRDYWAEVKGWTNTYLDFELGKPLPSLIGKKLWIDLGMYTEETETEEHVRETVRALLGKWRKVHALEMRDEPPWSLAKLQAKALMVKRVVIEEGLASRPVGCTFTGGAILSKTNWQAPALDYRGLECYLDARPGEGPTAAAKRMEQYIAKLLARVGPKGFLILVAQSYARNGTWSSNVPALVAIQEPIFRAAKALGPRLIQLSLFAYARAAGHKPPESVIDIAPLRAELKRLRRVYP